MYARAARARPRDARGRFVSMNGYGSYDSYGATIDEIVIGNVAPLSEVPMVDGAPFDDPDACVYRASYAAKHWYSQPDAANDVDFENDQLIDALATMSGAEVRSQTPLRGCRSCDTCELPPNSIAIRRRALTAIARGSRAETPVRAGTPVRRRAVSRTPVRRRAASRGPSRMPVKRGAAHQRSIQIQDR